MNNLTLAQRVAALSPEQHKRLEKRLKRERIDICQYTIEFSPIPLTEKKEYYKLSSAQKRLYILQQLEPEGIVYNVPHIIPLEDEIHLEKLEAAIKKIIQRHESLRTSFEMIDGEPVQRIHDEVELKIEYFDLSTEGIKHPETINKSFCGGGQGGQFFQKAPPLSAGGQSYINDFIRPFDLSRVPLVRIRLIKASKSQQTLLFDIHHIITDGTSQNILTEEFLTIYKEKDLPVLRTRYRDTVEWQTRGNQKKLIRQQERYWTTLFSNELPILNLPTDFPRPALQSFAGATVHFILTEKETNHLKSLAREVRATLYMSILSLVTILISKLGVQEDIIIGTPVAARRHVDLERSVGMFANTLALRNYPSGNKTVKTFLKEVKELTTAAFNNQEYPFEELVEKVVTDRVSNRNPLFDVMFAFQDIPGIRTKNAPIKTTSFNHENRIAKFDLTFNCFEMNHELNFSLEYCVRLFTKETIRRFIRYFKKLVSALVDTNMKLSALEIITEKEREKILYGFNDTKANYPADKTIHQLFEVPVEKTPNHVALVSKEKERKGRGEGKNAFGVIQLTYRFLNDKANQLAHLLQQRGVAPDTMVGIMMERSIELIIGILGILKAGGAYLPLDTDCPEERILYMLADSDAKVLVTTNTVLEERKRGRGEGEMKESWEGETIILALDYYPGKDEVSSPALNQHATNPANLAYVIYTSGSTGRPKGVLVEHQNIVVYVNAFCNQFAITSNDVYLQQSSFSFDAFVEEVYPILLRGGKMVICPRDVVLDMDWLSKFLVTQHITIVSCSPLLLNEINKLDFPDTLHTFISGGDVLRNEFVTKLLKLGNVYNSYGPTETTVCASYYKCTPEDSLNIPIGKPIDNIQLYIVDKELYLQPIGVSGELCIAGVGLARGYLNRPELTAEKFCLWQPGGSFCKNRPLDPRKNFLLKGIHGKEDIFERALLSSKLYPMPYALSSRLYKTGDLARWLTDGNIEFLGRMDFQVKIRGFRIELEEIEHQLLKHEDITEAVVIPIGDNVSGRDLYAYIVSAKKLPPLQLKEYLSEELPGYMIPAFFVPLERIPLTPSGKIDRKALSAPEIKPGEDYTTPRNEIERKLQEIWSEVLGIDKGNIGIDTNFFQLGGHSIKAILLISKIHKEMEVKIPLAALFKTPTLAGIAKKIKEKPKNKYSSIKSVEKKEYYHLSSTQNRLYVLYRMNPQSIGYNLIRVVTVKKGDIKEKLEQTFEKLVQRHESLRTSFEILYRKPAQKIHDKVKIEIEYSNPWHQGIIINKQPITRIIDNFLRPFDLSRPPLLRVGLIKLETEKYLLMVDMHHIITDGISQGILIQELMSLYSGKELPPLKYQYKDFSEWQNKLFDSGLIIEQERYWLKEFEGEIPELKMPLDYPRPEVKSLAGDALYFEIDKELLKKLHHLVLDSGSSLYMVLMAVFNILLFKYTRQEDIIVGTPITGRRHTDLQNINGMFVNMLAIRTQPQEEKSFQVFLEEVKEKTLAAFENQDYQFEMLVMKLGLQGELGKNPLFKVVLAMQNKENKSMEIDESTGIDYQKLHAQPYEYDPKVSKFDMLLGAFERDDTITMKLEYSTELFRPSTTAEISKHYIEILKQAAENKEIKLKDIELSHELVPLKPVDLKCDEKDFGF